MMSTIFVAQEGPANALALNKDYTQVVIAGRNGTYEAVFTIDEESFTEIFNLRVGKNINLNFSCNDVAWSAVDENIIATAATSGAVVIWNLNRQGRSKQEHVFMDHKRTVNKVSFHSTDGSCLISGSQDGTMKCFDLRTREAVKTFVSNTEVRDVQFNPHTPTTFAAVSENGIVQLWDMRRTDKVLHQFTAHSGPIYACDWHPEAGWLATASRDNSIKVWDLIGKPSLEYTIHTIASVGRVKWRPQRKYHIASCAMVLDYSINIWDVRRPYIPFASFNEHRDIVKGIAWKGDPHIFLSTSKDCMLYRHSFNDAFRPASKANPQGVSVNCNGDMLYAKKTTVSSPPTAKLTGLIRKGTLNSEQFHSANSSLQQLNSKALKDSRVFKECALKYILSGKPVHAMCSHNAEVSTNAGKHQVGLVWRIIQTLCPASDAQSVQSNDQPSLGETSSLGQYGINDEIENGDPGDLGLGNLGIGVGTARPSIGGPIDGEFDTNIESNIKNSILYQGPHDSITDWTLSTEAFPLKHDVNPPEPSQPATLFLGQTDCTVTVVDQPSTLRVSQNPPAPIWDPTPIISSCLHHHVEMGDLQTAVCILLVLGQAKAAQCVDELTQEHWFTVYIELLSRLKLWQVSTEIIRLCWLPAISDLNQRSTTMHTNCGQCGRSLTRSGWLCGHCKSVQSARCSVCHQTVRGLYVWCQGCSHGGHIQHIAQWMSKHRQCPTGCGHMCEY